MVTVADYDPAWPGCFEALRAEYAGAMAAAVIAVEHVGGTAVPGLAAKPVIDCDSVVRAADVPAVSAVLVSMGFTALGELGIGQRWAFRDPARLGRTNTYVIAEGCLSLRKHRSRCARGDGTGAARSYPGHQVLSRPPGCALRWQAPGLREQRRTPGRPPASGEPITLPLSRIGQDVRRGRWQRCSGGAPNCGHPGW